MEKVAAKIVVRQVELSNLVNTLKKVTQNVHTLFRKLCDTSTLTKDINGRLDRLKDDLQNNANALTVDASSSAVHLSKLNFQLGRLTELSSK